MLKIKDATGKVVGVLKDEDDAPEMLKDEKPKAKKEEGEEDANTEDADVR